MNAAVSSGGTLRLQTNIPEVIALEFSEGRAVQSQFGGDQVMYTLTDGRRMYLSPFVAQKISDAGITAGVPFEMCKREVARGNQRSVEFQIRTINDDVHGGGAAAETAPPPAATIATNQQTNHNAPVRMPVASAAAVAVVPAAAAAEPTTIAVLKRAGLAAVDAVLEVESYARSRGMVDFEFGAENIQKVWLALYIDARKTGGRA